MEDKKHVHIEFDGDAIRNEDVNVVGFRDVSIKANGEGWGLISAVTILAKTISREKHVNAANIGADLLVYGLMDVNKEESRDFLKLLTHGICDGVGIPYAQYVMELFSEVATNAVNKEQNDDAG